MSHIPAGRMKKCEPLDTSDFVPFTDFCKLSLQNLKDTNVFPEARAMFWQVIGPLLYLY